MIRELINVRELKLILRTEKQPTKKHLKWQCRERKSCG